MKMLMKDCFSQIDYMTFNDVTSRHYNAKVSVVTRIHDNIILNSVTIAQAVSKLHWGGGGFWSPPPPPVPDGQKKPGLDRVKDVRAKIF